MRISEIFKLKNFYTLKKAILKEPIDIIFRNAFRKIFEKSPLNISESYYYTFKKLLIKARSKVKLETSYFIARVNLWNNPKIGVLFILPSQIIESDHFNQLDSKDSVFKRLKIPTYYFLSDSININNKNKSETEISFVDKAQIMDKIFGEKIDYILVIDRLIIFSIRDLINLIKLLQNKDPEISYLDHFRVDKNKKYHCCKPSFNLDYYLAYDYLKSPLILRKKLFLKILENIKISTLNPICSILLGEVNTHNNITRIPELICKIPDESKQLTDARILQRKKIIEDYLVRKKIEANVQLTSNKEVFYINRKLLTKNKVSIIIPFNNQSDLTIKCVESIIQKTTYNNFEILLISNNSKSSEIEKVSELFKSENNINLLEYNIPFNYSAINNWGALQSNGEYILFLNNDTEIVNKGWLTNMLKHIQRVEVGAVGSLLLYGDKTIQHAGVIIGIGHVAAHAHRHFKYSDYGYMNRIILEHQVSAVTGACLLTKKSVFNKLGGFDFINLPISNNDVDFCLKIISLGLKIIYTPKAVLFHHESKSRKSDLSKSESERYLSEISYMKEFWNLNNYTDRNYHPKLTKYSEDFKRP